MSNINKKYTLLIYKVIAGLEIIRPKGKVSFKVKEDARNSL